MSMYEIGKFIVYKFTVYCIVYSKLLFLTSLQVYSLQQVVVTYKFIVYSKLLLLTSHWLISELLHFCTVDS